MLYKKCFYFGISESILNGGIHNYSIQAGTAHILYTFCIHSAQRERLTYDDFFICLLRTDRLKLEIYESLCKLPLTLCIVYNSKTHDYVNTLHIDVTCSTGTAV